MKKRWLLIAIAGSIVLVLLIFRGRNFISSPEKIYQVKDTARVHFIQIAGKDTIELNRKEGNWILGKSGKAERMAVDNLLYTLANMEITGISRQAIPGKEGREIRIKAGKQMKSFRVHPAEKGIRISTAEDTESFFLNLTGAENADLYSVFSDDPEHWKGRKLLGFESGSIQSLQVIPLRDPEESFILMKRGDSLFFNSSKSKEEVDERLYERMLMYYSFYSDLYFISEVNNPDIITRTGKSEPWYRIEIEGPDGDLHGLDFFRMKDLGAGNHLFEGYLRYNDSAVYRINFSETDLWFAKSSDFVDE